MHFMGDCHGKYKQYSRLIKQYPGVVCVGDMGVGFRRLRGYRESEWAPNPPAKLMDKYGARYIRGNHDNPEVCKRQKQCIKDGTVEETHLGKVMYVGGAFSIDHMWRTKGYDWWEDEELTHSEFYDMMDIYEATKPDVMVTHDCPSTVCDYMYKSQHRFDNSRTQQAFSSMFAMYEPALWVFGHHHVHFDKVIGRTRFVCLPELYVMEFS